MDSRNVRVGVSRAEPSEPSASSGEARPGGGVGIFAYQALTGIIHSRSVAKRAIGLKTLD